MRDLIWRDGQAIIVETNLTCTPAQMRLALHRADLLETVDAIAASDPEGAIVWQYATVIERNSPFIAALAGNPIRPFTDAEIDDLFRAAQAAF